MGTISGCPLPRSTYVLRHNSSRDAFLCLFVGPGVAACGMRQRLSTHVCLTLAPFRSATASYTCTSIDVTPVSIEDSKTGGKISLIPSKAKYNNSFLLLLISRKYLSKMTVNKPPEIKTKALHKRHEAELYAWDQGHCRLSSHSKLHQRGIQSQADQS